MKINRNSWNFKRF